MIIYKTTNLITGRIYIGKDVSERSRYLGSGKILKLAIKKYGKSNFIKTVIERCEDRKVLAEREIFWINYFKQNHDLYNIAEGGEGGRTTDIPWNKGKKLPPLSDEHKKKQSIALTGHTVTTQTRIKISKGLTGKLKTDEHKQKISITNRGRVLSNLTRERMSKARKGIKQKTVTCPRCGQCGGMAMYRWHFDNCSK